LVKVGGKQIKKSLKTADLALAKRRLAEFRAKAERLSSTGIPSARDSSSRGRISCKKLADDRRNRGIRLRGIRVHKRVGPNRRMSQQYG